MKDWGINFGKELYNSIIWYLLIGLIHSSLRTKKAMLEENFSQKKEGQKNLIFSHNLLHAWLVDVLEDKFS